MCNIAGYIGERRAAPILVDMMRRQSGFNGGYYTGLATVHEGKIYMAKVVGDLDRLLEKTDALDLPGTCGIIHSRTPGGGDREWAHPFLSWDEKIACVVNGANGAFEPWRDREGALVQLRRDNVHFSSLCATFGKRKLMVDEYHCVHVSEVLTHLFRSYMIHEGASLDVAMEKAYLSFPLEIVALGLEADAPGRISYARMNAPMLTVRANGEVYLASCVFAFPPMGSDISVLPAASSGTVTARETRTHTFTPPLPILPADREAHSRAEKCMETVLKNTAEPQTFETLCAALRPLCPAQAVAQRALLVYDTLWAWHLAGRLEICPFTVAHPTPDTDAGLSVTRFGVRLH